MTNNSQEYLEKLHRKVLDKARKHFPTFVRYVLPTLPKLAPMHYEWIDAMNKNRQTLIVAPREHGKSVICGLLYPLWMLGRNRNLRIKVISGSERGAMMGSKALIRMIRTSKPYHEVFPWIKIDEGVRSNSEVLVFRDEQYANYRDPSIAFYGITSQAEGSRADILICDDLCTRRNSQTEGLRKIIRDQFFSVLMNTLDETPWTKVIYIGTRWHAMDLTGEIMRKSANWKILQYTIDEEFNPLWPAKWSKQALINKYIEDPISFDQNYRNIPEAVENLGFQKHHIDQCIAQGLNPYTLQQEMSELKEKGKVRIIFGIDLATTKKHSGAANVLAIVGYTPQDNKRHLIDIIRGRFTAPEFMRIILAQYSKWHPEVVAVESNGYQKTLVEWSREFTNMPIKPVYTTEQNKWDKETGVMSMDVELENMMWRFPDVTGHNSLCVCSLCIFFKELRRFPFGSTTDTVMAVFFCRQIITNVFRGMQRSRILILDLEDKPEYIDRQSAAGKPLSADKPLPSTMVKAKFRQLTK